MLRPRWGVCLLACLTAASAVELQAGDVVAQFDAQGRLNRLSLSDRPAPLVGTAGWDMSDLTKGLDDSDELPLDEQWPAENDLGVSGPRWLLGRSWRLLPNAAQGHPTAVAELATPGDTDALRLTFPVIAGSAYVLRVPLRQRELHGRLRLGLVPLNGVGQASGAWVPFDPPAAAATGEWQVAVGHILPPPGSAWVELWIGLEGAVGRLEVGGLTVDTHFPAPLKPVAGQLTTTDAGCRFQGQAGDLTLTATYRAVGAALKIHAELATTGDVDRAVMLRWCVPLEGSGWAWWHDLDRSTTIASDTERLVADWRQVGAGHMLSPWPLGCVTRAAPAQGLALATPLAQPVITRFGFRGDTGLMVWFDLGLAPRDGHRSVAVDFVLYGLDPAWGMRAAIDRYHEVFDDPSAATMSRSGAWFAGLNPQATGDPSRFGLLFDEQAATHLNWARNNELVCLTSLSPWGRRLAAGEPPPPGRGDLLDSTGQPVRWLTDDGEVFAPWSTAPGLLPDGPAGWLNAQLAEKLRGDDGKPLDGLCLDGLATNWAGWCVDDYSRAHWQATALPLTTSRELRRPVLLSGVAHLDWLQRLAGQLRRRGQVLLGNVGTEVPLPFVVPWLDVVGAGEGAPDHNGLMWLRALAPHKPVSFLEARLVSPSSNQDELGDLWQRAVLWGAFPGATGWLSAKQVRTQTALFDRYVPALRELAAAGWEPVPYGQVSDTAVALERYGRGDDLYLVLSNPTGRQRQVSLTLDPINLGLITTRADGTPERRLVFVNQLSLAKKAIEFRVVLDRWQTTLALAPRTSVVLTPYKVKAGFGLFGDTDVTNLPSPR